MAHPHSLAAACLCINTKDMCHSLDGGLALDMLRLVLCSGVLLPAFEAGSPASVKSSLPSATDSKTCLLCVSASGHEIYLTPTSFVTADHLGFSFSEPVVVFVKTMSESITGYAVLDMDWHSFSAKLGEGKRIPMQLHCVPTMEQAGHMSVFRCQLE